MKRLTSMKSHRILKFCVVICFIFFSIRVLQRIVSCAAKKNGSLYVVQAQATKKRAQALHREVSWEEVRMHPPTQGKYRPLHFPKRRPGPGGTVDRFRALLPGAQR